MIYNVVTSLNRLQNLEELYANLAFQDGDVEWHIVSDWSAWYEIRPLAPWVHMHRILNRGGDNFWERCHYALNWFLDHVEIKDDQYYCFLNDDDAYESHFFEKVEKCRVETSASLIMVNMMRGHNTPPGVDPLRAHGTGTLIAAPEYMHPGYVGLEQAIIRGELLHKARIPLTTDGDGKMIEWLCSNYSPVFLQDANVWFNYWEPGRWQK